MATARSMQLAIWGAAALAAALLGFILWGGQGAPISSGFAAPEFHLASTAGGERDSASLKGKPFGVFFGFTHCPEVCPTTLFEMSGALQELGDQARDFRLFFVTVDPEQDTLPFVKDYLASFDPRIEGIVPTIDQLPATARAFHIYYKKVPTDDGAYTMDHTATVFLFGADGALKSTISYDEDHATRVEKLKRLLAGG